MNLKEGDILYNGTDVFQVTACIAEPQVTIRSISTSGEPITYPLSKLPKNMVKLVPETDRGRRRKASRAPPKVSRTPQARTFSFRGNSKMKRAYPFIKQAGKALTIVEILEGIGEPTTPANRATMAGDLYRFVKKNSEIRNVGTGLFAYRGSETMPTDNKQTENQEVPDLPDTFGKD